jgi:hypothetical protein
MTLQRNNREYQSQQEVRQEETEMKGVNKKVTEKYEMKRGN